MAHSEGQMGTVNGLRGGTQDAAGMDAGMDAGKDAAGMDAHGRGRASGGTLQVQRDRRANRAHGSCRAAPLLALRGRPLQPISGMLTCQMSLCQWRPAGGHRQCEHCRAWAKGGYLVTCRCTQHDVRTAQTWLLAQQQQRAQRANTA